MIGKNRVTIEEDIETIETDRDDQESPPPPLTTEEKALIKSTWAKIEADAEAVGPMAFVNQFEMPPEKGSDSVPFKSIEVNNERFNKILRNHGLKVFNTIRKMVSRIEEDDKMVAAVEATGCRHAGYGGEASLTDLMCPQFMQAIQSSLDTMWSVEVEQAYTHLSSILTFHMKKSWSISEKENDLN
ncbi:cytoglobin-2-like [Watersipora subatra]|uniref:cytoglobin-2-like n=1 Tax=Watersipora subatra TaxID=2589382 RepID=UPI00355BF5BD